MDGLSLTASERLRLAANLALKDMPTGVGVGLVGGWEAVASVASVASISMAGSLSLLGSLAREFGRRRGPAPTLSSVRT